MVAIKPGMEASNVLSLSCFDGVRVVANIWVMLVHCWELWSMQLSYETLHILGNHSWLPWLATQGACGADIFLVLSALLATYQLLPALESGASGGAKQPGAPTWRVVLTYWRKRALRIVPAYAVANLLALALFRPTSGEVPSLAGQARSLKYSGCPASLWANALFLTNSLSTPETCGSHLWTISVLVHFYLAWPLLLCALRPRVPGFRARVAAALGAAAAAGTAWRFWAAWRTDFHMPAGDRNLAGEEANLNRILDALYLPTLSRVQEMAVGASLGLLLRSRPALSWVTRRPALVSGTAFALQATYLLAVSGGSLYPPPGTPHMPATTARLIAALWFYGSPFYACLISATLLALVLCSDPLHAAAAWLLGTPPFKAAAMLSYSVYLLHEMVKVALVVAAPALLAAWIQQAPLAALTGLTGATLVASYAVGWLSWRLIEQRF